MAITSSNKIPDAQSEELSIGGKLAYAIGDLAASMGPGTIVPFWYLFFLTDVARIPPSLAGITILIGGLWDAVNDPIVGMLSDRTRTRWGRRRPFLLFGAVPFAITFALLWYIPPIENRLLLSLYFALIYILFDTSFTLVSCPYIALTPELTLNHDERTSLTTYRMTVSILGGLLAAIGFSFVLDFYPDKESAFMYMGVVSGLLFAPVIFITFFGTREREDFQAEPPLSPLESLRYVWQNKMWRYTLGMRLLSWIPVDIASAVFVYFLIYWIKMEPMEASLVQAAILASATAFLPFVLWMARRWEKKISFMVSMMFWAIVMFGVLFIPQEAKALTYMVAVLIGPGIAAAHVLPTAMGADTLDVDELNSHKRQEGIYSGFEVFIRKLATKLVLAGIGPVLTWAGYVENASQQSPQALMAIRMTIAIVPMIILLAGVFVAWKYPLTRAYHQEIQAIVAMRRGAK